MFGIVGDIARALLPTPEAGTPAGRRARERQIRAADAHGSRLQVVRGASAKDRYPTRRG